MAAYSIFFKESIGQDLRSIPRKDRRRILERVALLAEDPRPRGCQKLGGQEWYRVRQGRYRIIYSIQDAELTVWVIRIGHRSDVYRS